MKKIELKAVCGWFTLLTVVFLMSGETSSAAPPACTVMKPDYEVSFAAGCMVRFNNKLLVIRHATSGKLGYPAGFAQPGESAQCTAHRETWEETGIEVKVGNSVKRFNNGFLLYRCKLTETMDPNQTLDVPNSGTNEVSGVLWIDPNHTVASDWRFPEDYQSIIRLFNQLEEQ